MDILIRNESAKFLCAIENKVWASESGDQLAWYRKVLAFHYPNHRVHRVFLTPGAWSLTTPVSASTGRE